MALFMLTFMTTSLVMGLVILAVTAIKILLPGVITAKLRYVMWLIVLLGLAIPLRPLFGGGLLNISTPLISLTNSTTYSDFLLYTGEQIQFSEPNSLLNEYSSNPTAFLTVLAIIWAVIALFIFIYHIWRYIRFSKLVKRWSVAIEDEPTLSIFRAIKEEKGLVNKTIGLRVCGFISTSMLLGFVNPVVLLPDKKFDEDELDMIFRHELIHYERKDVFVKLLSVFAVSLNWFNPAIYLMSAEMQADCEASCDEAVLAETGNDSKQFYAELIMEMIGDKKSNGTMLSTCFYGSKRGLRIRMEAIMNGANSIKKVALTVPMVVIVLMIFAGSVFAFNPPATEQNMSRAEGLEIILQSMDLSIDQISDLIVEEEWINGELSWEFYFSLDGERHNMYVHAATGSISFPHLRISEQDAISAAMSFANTTEDNIRVLDIYIGIFRGVLVWEVVMEANGTLNDFKVDIYTAEILYVMTLDFLP